MDANCSTVEANNHEMELWLVCVRDHQDKVLEVCLSSDRVMAVKLVL